MRVKFGSFTANAWGRSFLGHCTREMKGLVPNHKSAANRIRDNAQGLFWEHEPSVPDKQGRTILASCCVVLAAYRELRSSLTEAEAYEAVRTAMYRTYQKPTWLLVRVWLWLTRDPLKQLRGKWLHQIQRMYGSGMQFDQEETEISVDIIIRRCAFHAFFLEQGEPELTRVLCAWDRNWMDIVDASRHSIRTERPTTISTGGDCCRIRLTRSDGSRQGVPNDIICRSFDLI
jgi:hypothetical protein